MKTQQSGFTLIELVMVIVIIGILAAVAIPKYVNLQAEAYTATANGIAGAIASSAVIRYSANQINSTTYPYDQATACTGGAYLQPAGVPSGCTAAYTVATTSCIVTCSTHASSSVVLP